MRAFLIGLVLAGAAAMPVSAQVTQTYNYDANGRLTGVTTAGGAGTNSAAYVYDDANNRTQRSQSGSGAYALLDILPPGRSMAPNEALASANGEFTLAVRASGLLELWRSGQSLGAPDLAALGLTARIDDGGEVRFGGDRAADGGLILGDDGRLSILSMESAS